MKYIKRKKIEFNSDNEEKTLLTIGNCLKTKNRFDFLYENARIIRRKIEMINQNKVQSDKIDEMKGEMDEIKNQNKKMMEMMEKMMKKEEKPQKQKITYSKINITARKKHK